MLDPAVPRLDLDDGHRGDVAGRWADDQVGSGGKLDRAQGQRHPHGHLGPGEPARVHHRPPTTEPFRLAFDLGLELIPLVGPQTPDPRHQVALMIVHGERGQSIGHRVADGAHGDQLSEEDVHDGPAGQGHRQRALAELGRHVVGLTGQHPRQPVLGHHQWRTGPHPFPTTRFRSDRSRRSGSGRSGSGVCRGHEPGLETGTEPAGQLGIGVGPGPTRIAHPFQQVMTGERLPATRMATVPDVRRRLLRRMRTSGRRGGSPPPGHVGSPVEGLHVHHHHAPSLSEGCHSPVGARRGVAGSLWGDDARRRRHVLRHRLHPVRGGHPGPAGAGHTVRPATGGGGPGPVVGRSGGGRGGRPPSPDRTGVGRRGDPRRRAGRHAAGAHRARLRPGPHLRLLGRRGQRCGLRRRSHPRRCPAHDRNLARSDPRGRLPPGPPARTLALPATAGLGLRQLRAAQGHRGGDRLRTVGGRPHPDRGGGHLADRRP